MSKDVMNSGCSVMSCCPTAVGRMLQVAFVSLLLMGCGTTVDLSHESPYQEMVGQCYELQQDMYVVSTMSKCWLMGDLLLTPHLRVHCLADKVASVPQGTEVTLVAIQKRVERTGATCPLLIVDIPGMEFLKQDVSLPACERVRFLSWNDSDATYWWFPDDEFRLKEEYVKPCTE